MEMQSLFWGLGECFSTSQRNEDGLRESATEVFRSGSPDEEAETQMKKLKPSSGSPDEEAETQMKKPKRSRNPDEEAETQFGKPRWRSRNPDEEAETQLRIWVLLDDRSDNVGRDMRE